MNLLPDKETEAQRQPPKLVLGMELGTEKTKGGAQEESGVSLG